MADFNVQQKATIDSYRSTHNLGFVVTDEYIAELIKKEMEQTGVVYAGFESLAKSVAKSQIKQPAPNTNANIKTNTTASIFGTQIIDNEFDLGFSSKNTTTYPEIQPTESQSKAINFLKDITSDAETIFKNREDEAGALSAVVNTWQEVFNKQYAKSTIKKELQTAKEDLRLLEQASKGQVGYTDFLGNTHIRSFEDVFKQRRGVKFNEQAVADCTEKAEQFAAIKTSVEMINQTKQTLGYTTKGDVHSQMNPQEASSAIIKAFQLSGINSLDEMNKTLQDIEQKYKNHTDIQKYGGNFKFAKNKQGQYVIYRIAKNGYPAEATNEQLRVIAKEMGLRLDKALATALGVEYSANATPEEMANLTQQTYDKYQKEYEDSFAKAYGKKDVKALAEAYVLTQQQGVANIEMGLNIASMALMVIPGGAVATSGWALKGALLAKHTATGAKVVKGLQLVDKAKTFVKGAQTLQKVSQIASPFIMANMTLRPTELLEQLTSKNGMSAEEWKTWGQGVLQNSIYMAAGMGASKLAETGAAMYKTKALVNTLKSAGKSTDEIMAMIKANPVKFPNEIVKSLSKVDTLAKTLQVTSEVALDIGSTILVNKAMGNGDLLPQDVINSIAFAISGGVLQKQFAPLSTETKVSFIEKALKKYGITKVEAERILKTMDDISAGKIRAKDVKPLDDHHDTQMLDEVVVTAARSEIEVNGQRFSTNNVVEESVSKSNNKVLSGTEAKTTTRVQSNIETISDIEFNQLKAKIESNPSFPEPNFFGRRPNLSKENILFVEKLLENTELVKKLDTNQLSRIINNCWTNKASQAKMMLLEKFECNPDLINNPYIASRLESILSGIETIESLKGLDILFVNPKLLMIPNIDSILKRLNNEYSVKAFEKMLDIPEFLSNSSCLERILYNTGNEYSFKFLEQIFKIPEILKIDLNLIADLIKNTELDMVNITKLELFNDWIKNPENLSNKELTSCFLRGLSEDLGHVDEYKHLQRNGKSTQSNLDYETVQRGNVFQNVLETFTKEFPEFSNKYYYMYLEKVFLQYTPAEANRFRQICKSINEEYGVKVILPSDLKEVGQSLILIYQELNNYKMHSKGCAKMPPILDFITPFEDRVGGIAHIYDTNNIGIRELNIDFIKHSLRHEMAHINDTKQLQIFPFEIRSFKPELGEGYRPTANFDVHRDLDINNCKFADELKNAGIAKRTIEYAYTNPLEFVAVASQGDFSKYSPEFKSYLVELGMPEWMLNFQNLKPFFINSDNAKFADNSASVHLESVTNNTSNPRMINSEDNISPSETIQMQEDNKALQFKTEVIQKENFSKNELKIVNGVKKRLPQAKKDVAISISKNEKYNTITFKTREGEMYNIIQYNEIDFDTLEDHVKKIQKIKIGKGKIDGGHSIEYYERLTKNDLMQKLRDNEKDKVDVDIKRPNDRDIEIYITRPTGGGNIVEQKLLLEYQDKNPPFYRVKSNKSTGKLVDKKETPIKTLMHEALIDEILDFMKNNPKETLSYYSYTDKKENTIRVFKFKEMYYIQGIRKNGDFISFYPISKEDLIDNDKNIIFEKIPIWK